MALTRKEANAHMRHKYGADWCENEGAKEERNILLKDDWKSDKVRYAVDKLIERERKKPAARKNGRHDAGLLWPRGYVRAKIRGNSARRNGTNDGFVPPPSLNWEHIENQFYAAQNQWYRGLRAYEDVMELIEEGATKGGSQYQKVARLAQRGQATAMRLLEQQNSVQDDLRSMQYEMPHTGDDEDY
jgi:hypothetical protein